MKRALQTFLVTTSLVAAMVCSSWAGPVAEFESRLRDAYGDYRKALFMTNAGKKDEARAAMSNLQEKWDALITAYGTSPPPHYADDSGWTETLKAVSGLSQKASGEIEAGQLPKAHETLEGVRDAIWKLHERNSFTTFSDRMNAYHTKMEEVLRGSMDGKELNTDDLQDMAAILRYLAQDALDHPPVEAQTSPDYKALAKAFARSVDKLKEAARSRDKAAIKAAISGLKPAYSKLFLEFG